MGIRIDGASDLINATDGSLTIEGQSINSTGVGTFSGGVKVGSAATIHSTGQFNIGVAATIFANGNATYAGIVTASSFVGSGANLTGIPALTGSTNNEVVTVTGANAIQGETKLTFSGALLEFAINNNSQGFKISATGNHIPEFIFDANRSQANDNLGRTEYYWNGTEVAAIAGIAGDDTTNKDDGQIKIQTRPSGGSLTERLRINSSGNLKIGNTADRDLGGLSVQRLHIEGTDGGSSAIGLVNNQNSTGQAAIYFSKSRGTSVNSNTVLQSGDPMGALVFCGSDGSDMASVGAEIRTEVDGTPGSNDMPGRIVFKTTADGSASSTERLRIANDGAVNIGASGDVYDIWNTLATDQNVKLQVRTTVGEPAGMAILQERGDSNGANLIIGKSRSGNGVGVINSGDTLGFLKWSGADGTRQHNAAGIGVWNSGTVATGRVAGNMSIYTAPDSVSAMVERIRIVADGTTVFHGGGTAYNTWAGGASINVGSMAMINTGSSGTSNWAWGIRGNSGDTQWCLERIKDESSFNDSNIKFRVYNNGNYLFAGSDASDRDIKENILDITGTSLDKIKQLRPRTFNFKESEGYPTKTKSGFIAQEVASVIPSITCGTDGQKDMGVDYNGLVAHLVKAIKELSAKVEELETKVAALESA